VAHAAELPDNVATALHDRFREHVATMSQDRWTGLQGSREAILATLRRDWGPGFDENLALATRVVGEVGGRPLIDMLEQSGLGDDPRLIKVFAQAGRRMFRTGDPATGTERQAIGAADEATEARRAIMRLCCLD